MKLFLALVISSFGFSTFASSIVCVGKTIQYRNITNDTGIRPPPGFLLGSITLKISGKVLVDQKFVEGTFSNYTAYSFDSIEQIAVISSSGNKQQGSSVTKELAVVHKTNPIDGTSQGEVAREEVTCKRSWRMAI
jgi:hypothetical protein